MRRPRERGPGRVRGHPFELVVLVGEADPPAARDAEQEGVLAEVLPSGGLVLVEVAEVEQIAGEAGLLPGLARSRRRDLLALFHLAGDRVHPTAPPRRAPQEEHLRARGALSNDPHQGFRPEARHRPPS